VTDSNSEAPGRDGWVVAAGCLGSACFFVALIAYNFVDIDLWHQMALIRESLTAGHLLRADVYAYTPTTRPWVDHEWGAGAVAYFVSTWLGDRGILLIKFSLALGTFLLCRQAARVWDADTRLFALCSPLAIFLMYLGYFSAVRAQTYTFFFTALLVFTWRKMEKGHRQWAILWLAFFPLWVNLHAGFVVGVGLTALYCMEKSVRREPFQLMLVLCSGMLLETSLTPYGWSYVSYLRRALSMSRPYSAEWGGMWHMGFPWTFCFLAAVTLTVYSAIAAGLRHTPGLLPLAATAVEAALHRKHLPLFAVVWLCCTPVYLQRTGLGEFSRGFVQKRRGFVVAAWTALACASLVAAIRQKPWHLSVPQPLYPVGAVKYLAEQHCQGKLMVPFRLGAYVSWRLYPAIQVSLDSRYEEVFEDEVVTAVFDFYEGRPGWQRALLDFPPDFVLVPHDALADRRLSEAGWSRRYRDREFDIFTSPRNPLPPVDWSAFSFTDSFP